MYLQNTINDLLHCILGRKGLGAEEIHSFIVTLVACGCDFFEIMAEVACMSYPLSNDLLWVLQRAGPPPKPVPIINTSILRSWIPRWTSTKYHTGKIKDVIEDIHEKIMSREVGFYVYHSNRNPKRTTVDDLYLLLVSSEEIRFLDINRRRAYSYTFLQGGGEP